MARPKGKAKVEKKNRALQALEVQYVPIEDVTNNSYNSNRQSNHDFELLLSSIREDGFTQPVVCVRVSAEEIEENPDELGRYEPGQIVIVDGEHRWRAADVLGMKEIPIVITPMNLAQARIATLRHNRARGSEDYELSAQILRDLEQLGALDWAQESLMLDDVEINRLLEDADAPELLADEEYSEAWEPSSGEESDVEGLVDRNASSTPAAVQARREGEKKLAEAMTEQERVSARRDMDVWRVALTFSGEEGAIVKAVAGDAPAPAILGLCREQLEREGRLEQVLESRT